MSAGVGMRSCGRRTCSRSGYKRALRPACQMPATAEGESHMVDGGRAAEKAQHPVPTRLVGANEKKDKERTVVPVDELAGVPIEDACRRGLVGNCDCSYSEHDHHVGIDGHAGAVEADGVR